MMNFSNRQMNVSLNKAFIEAMRMMNGYMREKDLSSAKKEGTHDEANVNEQNK